METHDTLLQTKQTQMDETLPYKINGRDSLLSNQTNPRPPTHLHQKRPPETRTHDQSNRLQHHSPNQKHPKRSLETEPYLPPIESITNCTPFLPITGIMLDQKLCALDVGSHPNLEPRSMILKKSPSAFSYPACSLNLSVEQPLHMIPCILPTLMIFGGLRELSPSGSRCS